MAVVRVSLEYQIGDALYRVAVDGPPEGVCTVTMTPVDADGNEGEPTTLEARVVPVEANTFSFIVGDNHYLTHVVAGPDGHYVNIGGENFTVLPPEQLERQRRRGGGQDAEQHVTPPMPGQVVSVLVQVGDVVEAGQPVVVITAMKMETTLTAPHGGTVTAVNTSEGAQVMPGDILVDISEEDA